jgi:hypothetical protein
LLPISCFHVIFTVPHVLNPLALTSQDRFYDLLFSAPAQTLLEVAANPKHFSDEIGLLSIFHTWGQNLLLHPKMHCVIPGGGLAPDHQRWIGTQHLFLLPIPILRKVFRGKFTAELRRIYREGLQQPRRLLPVTQAVRAAGAHYTPMALGDVCQAGSGWTGAGAAI